ncbi:MAG: YlxR family protein, partial [Oscillospiraceae bacterium]
AYLCPNPECLKKARKARRLERAFSCQIPDAVYDAMEEEMAHE